MVDDIKEIRPLSFEDVDESSFGSGALTDNQISNFPDPKHRMVRRGIFSRQRNIDEFLNCLNSGRKTSIITGIGPSGNMHIGHITSLYFAKYIQEKCGTRVYIPISDDEKYLTRDMSFQSVQDYTLQNLREILAIGFDPSNTRIIVDTADSDIIYPLSVNFANDLTSAQVNAVFGNTENVGQEYYPAVQAAHLLLPQLVYGEHSTIMISGIDQDPHLRLARDIADKKKYPVKKPGSLLSQYVPSLLNPDDKMSSSDNEPVIRLNDTQSQIENKVMEHAYSGGKKLREEHERIGGDAREDIPYSLLYYFFEQDDEELERIHDSYTDGDMLSGEIKNLAAEKIWEFVSEHQARKDALGSLDEEIEPYRLTKTERRSALTRVGYSTELDIS